MPKMIITPIGATESLEYIESCIFSLQKALDVFIDHVGHPVFIAEPGHERFTYPKPNPRIFQTLKCVRIISTYNAGIWLLQKGYVQEVGALIRMIYEYLHDIDYIQQGVEAGKMTKKQNEMLTSFFDNNVFNVEERMTTHSKKPTVGRKSVYSEIGSKLNPENPDRAQKIIRVLEEGFSGYIHAAYSHIMELYRGRMDGGKGQFFTNGMLDTPRHHEFIGGLIRTLPQALNIFARLAHSLGYRPVVKELLAKRDELMKSLFYKYPHGK